MDRLHNEIILDGRLYGEDLKRQQHGFLRFTPPREILEKLSIQRLTNLNSLVERLRVNGYFVR